MKKILSLLAVLTMVLGLSACGNTGTKTDAPQSTQPDSETGISAKEDEISGNDVAQSSSTGQAEDTDADGTKILVAYFSRTGENYGVGYIEKGNTHMIAEQTGGDTFEIHTVTSYPDEYDECTEVAKIEQDEDARPELADSVEGMEDYDVIFLGYPNWWGDMPMAV